MEAHEFYKKHPNTSRLRVPRIVRAEDDYWAFEHEDLLSPIPQEAYSFAILPCGWTGDPVRLEAFPVNGYDIVILYSGTVEECIEKLEFVSERMTNDNIQHDITTDTHAYDTFFKPLIHRGEL